MMMTLYFFQTPLLVPGAQSRMNKLRNLLKGYGGTRRPGRGLNISRRTILMSFRKNKDIHHGSDADVSS